MKLYRIAVLAKPGDIIFGLVDLTQGTIRSRLVPKGEMKSQVLVSHQRLFGGAAVDASDGWRCDASGKCNWCVEPSQDVQHAVSNHLVKHYGIANVTHSYFINNPNPNPRSEYF